MTTIDTGTEDLLARKENGVGYLVMNRPEARNAMSQEEQSHARYYCRF